MRGRGSLRRCPGSVSTRRRPHPAVLLSAVVAFVGAVVAELVPWVGGDLVAQRWWQSWAASGGGQPVDLGWYAGSPAVSYSLAAPWVLAAVGPAVAGVASTVVGSGATTALLVRARALRPHTAGVLAAAMFAANQLSGRTTFGLGAAMGSLALLAAGSRARASRRRPLAGVLAVSSGALSPVAAVLLALAAAAWWLGAQPASPAGSSRSRRPVGARGRGLVGPPVGRAPDVVVVVVGAVLPLVVMRLLGGASGLTPSSAHQMVAAIAATVLVLLLVGADQPVLRMGAALTGGLLVATWLLADPIGSNATRIVLLFAVPVLVATARRDRLVVGLAAVLVTWLLPPLVTRDLVARDPVATERVSAPLLAELDRLGPVGRVEIVPLADHSDAALAQHVPIARGWTRQLDVVRNPLFYDGSLDAGSYLTWLRARGVSYVASSTQRPDWAGRAEAALVRSGVPGLTEVWSDDTWSLYEVDGPGVVLAGPGRVTGSDRRTLTVEVSGAGTVELALFWNPRLTVVGQGCLAAGEADGTVLLRSTGPGTATITSAWQPAGHC